MDTSTLEKHADILAQNVAGWEQTVVKRIANRLKKMGKMSVADAKALNNIAVVKQDMDAIMAELSKTTKMNIAQIEAMYSDVIATAHQTNKALYSYRGKDFVPFEENRRLKAIVRAAAKTTGQTMINLAKISAKQLGVMDNGKFRPLQAFYTDTIDRAVMQVSSGAEGFHTAMRDAIVNLGGSGIRVNYGEYTRRLDSVVRQALLWGAKQTYNEYSGMIAEELGCDGIEIDWHHNPRPSHEFMQGRQFSTEGKKVINGVKYEDASKALEALEDYGCLHFASPIICGISEPAYSPKELERLNNQNKKTYEIDGQTVSGYEATQMMRRLETGIREQKSIREAAKTEGGMQNEVEKATKRIKAYQKKYDEISQLTGISKEPKRMSITK